MYLQEVAMKWTEVNISMGEEYGIYIEVCICVYVHVHMYVCVFVYRCVFVLQLML